MITCCCEESVDIFFFFSFEIPVITYSTRIFMVWSWHQITEHFHPHSCARLLRVSDQGLTVEQKLVEWVVERVCWMFLEASKTSLKPVCFSYNSGGCSLVLCVFSLNLSVYLSLIASALCSYVCRPVQWSVFVESVSEVHFQGCCTCAVLHHMVLNLKTKKGKHLHIIYVKNVDDHYLIF